MTNKIMELADDYAHNYYFTPVEDARNRERAALAAAIQAEHDYTRTVAVECALADDPDLKFEDLVTPLYTAAPQPTELSDSDIEELTWHLSAEKEYENWTGREQLVVTGYIDFARAVLAAQKAKT